MSDKVPANIYKILMEEVTKETIEHFEVTNHDPNKKGDGFLGEMIYISLRNKKSGKVFDLVVKQAFTKQNVRDAHPIRNVFINEICFYTEIWPTFNEFQQIISPHLQFKKIPKCFATTTEENCEQLILENLKYKGFEVHDKKKPLDKQHFELIMKEYGKFHALSFAYRALYPENFEKLADKLQDLFAEFCQKDYFTNQITESYETSLENLEPGVEDKVIEIFKHYPKICMEKFCESLDCKTKYTVILHGDCWSNNLMFNYDEDKNVKDVRLLDFQLAKLGSPCCDLSYCIYSAASKEVLQNFNYYLEVYHKSLSATLRGFGCDPEKLYPLQALKGDWKKYCKLGLGMSLMVWRMKMTNDGAIRDLQDYCIQNDDEQNEDQTCRYNQEGFKEVTRNIILHLYENNYL